MSRTAIAGFVAAAVLIAGVAVILASAGNSNQQSQNTQSESSQNQTTAQGVITYNNGVFTPSSLTVKSGAVITIKNASSDVLEFNSSVHPTHSDNPDLNVGTVGSGGNKTFTVTQKGTFSYHNHLVASETGTITVE